MIFLGIVIMAVLVVSFGGVLAFGAPYLPTLTTQIETALVLLDLKPGQTLLELGSGDGKVLVAAARAGLNVVGVELNPFLVIVSRVRTRKYRKQVKIVWGNFWTLELPEFDGVFVFLLDRFMPKLDQKLSNLHKPFNLVSFAFKMPSKKVTIEKNGLFLYQYK